MPGPQRNSRILTVVLVVALAVFSAVPVIDRQANVDYESLFQRALVTFALARTLNGVISVVQGTELALQPAGVGLTLTPGEILDPVNDLVERFSWVMLGATVSLGIQNVLMEISSWWGTRLLVALLAIAWLLVRLRHQNTETGTDRILLRVFLIALFLRFAVPLSLIANDALYNVFLETRYESSTQVIETAGIELEQLGRDAGQAAAKAEEQSFFDSITSSFSNLDVKAKFERMKDRAAEVIEHLIELSVVFILQTAVLPMLFLWGLVQVVKRAFVWRFNGSE
jgi:hypothetical protein